MQWRYFLLYFLLFFPHFLSGQTENAKKEISLFTIQQARLEYERYKWGDEFFLKIRGIAHPMLDGAFLNVTLFYYDQQLCSTNLPLQYVPEKDQNRILFSLDWGPLNQPYQKAYTGNYQVELSFLLEHQIPVLRSKLQEVTKDKNIRSQKKIIPFGSSSLFQEEGETLRNFYSERIQKMKKMYGMILQHGMPRLSSSQNFDFKAWRKWLENFIQEVHEETNLLNKFQKKQFCCRYSIAKDSLIEYHDLVVRFGKLISIDLYQKHNLEPDKKDTNISSFGLKRLDMLQKNLERLLQQAGDDLKSEKILGEKK